jgi:hypothetical protein
MNSGKDIKLPFDHNGNMAEYSKIMESNETDIIKVNKEYYKMYHYSAD